jgi:hypothetical protein
MRPHTAPGTHAALAHARRRLRCAATRHGGARGAAKYSRKFALKGPTCPLAATRVHLLAAAAAERETLQGHAPLQEDDMGAVIRIPAGAPRRLLRESRQRRSRQRRNLAAWLPMDAEPSVSVCFSSLAPRRARGAAGVSARPGARASARSGSLAAPLHLVERAQRLQRARLEHGAAHHDLVQDGERLRGTARRGTCHARAPGRHRGRGQPRAAALPRAARLGRVEDEVQLADALEATVQRLHVHCGQRTRVSAAPSAAQRRRSSRGRAPWIRSRMPSSLSDLSHSTMK